MLCIKLFRDFCGICRFYGSSDSMSVGGTKQMCGRTVAIIKQTVRESSVQKGVNNAGFKCQNKLCKCFIIKVIH